jgi:hypothetical protein
MATRVKVTTIISSTNDIDEDLQKKIGIIYNEEAVLDDIQVHDPDAQFNIDSVLVEEVMDLPAQVAAE